MLTTQRRDKVAISSRSTDNESNFGDTGYEVTVRHEGRAKTENGTKKELHVLKKQLEEEHEVAQTDERVAAGLGTTMGTTCTNG